MNRKHFILASALSGLVAAILPKRGEPAPMSRATEVREPLPVPDNKAALRTHCGSCNHPPGDTVFWNPYNGLVQCHNCGAAAVPAPSPVNELPKLCVFDTPDGYWVIPRYRSGKYAPSPIYDPTGVGIKWRNGEGRERGAWFHTTEENMFSDAEALLLEARAGTLVNYPLGEGVSAELSDDVRDAIRAKYRAHITNTP